MLYPRPLFLCDPQTHAVDQEYVVPSGPGRFFGSQLVQLYHGVVVCLGYPAHLDDLIIQESHFRRTCRQRPQSPQDEDCQSGYDDIYYVSCLFPNHIFNIF